MCTRKLYNIALLVLCILPAQALIKPKEKLGNFEIISADKLDYQEGNSILSGHVKLKMGEFIVTAPKIYVDANKDGKPSLARFENGVVMKSDDLTIVSPKMKADIEKSSFKCFADNKTLVETHTKDAVIYSYYQDFDLNSGLGKASGEKDFERVKFVNDTYNISSNNMEFELNEEKKIKYLVFLNDVISISKKDRIESQELLYFPANETIKASKEVKVLYIKTDSNKEGYLFADALVYEQKEHLLSAFSGGMDRQAEFYAGDLQGKSRQILLTFDKENTLERAILTGTAFAQYEDKAMVGEEILFNAKTKQLNTVLGRPHTQIMKKP